MGYMRHHAILVTSWSDELIEAAHAQAEKMFAHVSSITPRAVNDYRSFFVPPDGSKEGWLDSDEADSSRREYIEWLCRQVYEDGSSSLKWCEVQFGDEEGENAILRDSEEYMRTTTHPER